MNIRKTGRATRATTGLALAGILMLTMGTEACAETQEESAQEASSQLVSAEQEAPAGDDEAAQQEAPGGDDEATQQEAPGGDEAAQQEAPAADEAAQQEAPAADEAAQQEAPAADEAAQQEAPRGDEAAQQEAPGGDEAAQQEEPAQEDPPGRQPSQDVRDTIERFKQVDPAISQFFENAAGYVVFPNIGKAGFGVGGAHGNGEVFESGQVIGKASMTQVTIGLQLGGQEYSELIFFKEPLDLERFTAGGLELAAQVSAVAITAGAADGANYKDGVVVFTRTKAGLMAEASVGGQNFSYEPY